MSREISPRRLAEASAVVPTARQVTWQEREFTGFIHFGMNTMTDREWGLGHEDPRLFDPAAVDVNQWMRELRSGGMRGVILTAKHHDGFCLWPSAHTRHSVASSPWRDGRGDLVKDAAEAAARHGLAFGVYLSPWDRTDARYGTGRAYDDFFVAQLTELLTDYGPISTVWLDGANGEGPDGNVQLYDWDRYYEVVRRLQPDAVISVCGPDVRWCGNEAGHTRAEEWSVVPASLRDAERIASRSQQSDDSGFARLVRSDEEDLGSRAALAASEDPLIWYPAEVNTSIRPGWFHHPAEDTVVRGADELFEIYLRSVGGNSGFLLNVPPTRDGVIAEPDVAVLRRLGALIADLTARDVAPTASVEIDSGPRPLPGVDDVWEPRIGQALHLSWPEAVTVDAVMLGEDIVHGQQIDGLIVDAETDGGDVVPIARAASIGYRRILSFSPLALRSLRVRVVSARGPVRVNTLRVLAASPSSDPGSRTRER